MKMYFHQNLSLNVASVLIRCRAAAAGIPVKLLFGVALLWSALVPAKVFAAASWSAAPTSGSALVGYTYTMSGLPTGSVKTMWFYNPNTTLWMGPYAQTTTSANSISYQFSFPSAGAWKAKVVTGALSTGTTQSTIKNVTVAKTSQPTAVTITSGSTTSQSSGYIATASGGNGTGALVWALGTGSTAAGAAINSSSGTVTTTGTGTVTFKVYRAADSTYNQSATTADFILTVAAPIAAISTLVGEAVTISSAVKGANSDVAFTVYDESAISPSLAINGGNAATIGESPSVVSAIMKPGKAYAISVITASCTDYWLNFTPPSGYSLLLDGVATNSIHNAVSASQLNIPILHFVQLRPESSYEGAPFGSFTGVQVGNAITWEVGLGNLRTGHSAGRLIFKEGNLSGNPVSRSKLFYTPPGNYGEIDVKFTADRSMRQIRLPQGFLDIVDDAAGGYWLNFYVCNLADGTIQAPGGNPALDTDLYIVRPDFAATPWKFIRVQLTPEGQLKITEKEN